MLLSDIVSIGDKIDVKQLDQSDKPMLQVRTYVSQLLDIIDHDVINIAMPIGNARVILLQVGESYSLCFYTSKGLYQCNCTVLRSFHEKNLNVSEVRLTSDLKKFQRRQYFRLECIHEIEYRTITQEEMIMQDKIMNNTYLSPSDRSEFRKRLVQYDQNWIKASITDISGGGAKFNSGEIHNPGDKVRIKLDFIISGELKKLVIGADIVASTKLLQRSGAYEHRVEFVDIGSKDREDLIKYIFEQERKRRKNEKV